MNDLISVIVPIYNVEDYLEQCLDSIINQTYTNLEILLINDGSTDRSGEICERYKAQDQRVRLFTRPGGGLGPSMARNLGLNEMQGSYVTFVDSDDWLDEMFIEKLYNQAQAASADIILTRYCRFIQENGSFLLPHVDRQVEFLDKETYLERLFLAMDDTYVITCCKLYASHLFNGELPLRFPEEVLTEDQYLSYQLVLDSKKIVLVNEILYCYRKREGSASNQFLSLKHIQDDLAGHSQRLVDVALAGYPIEQGVAFLRSRLSAYRQNLEETDRTDTETYRLILRKLGLR